MKRHWSYLANVVLCLATMLGASPAMAAGARINWTVAPSGSYTVTHNGGQPLVVYNQCLSTNTTYTIRFTADVDSPTSYNGNFATVGETTQFFRSMSFDPKGASGPSGSSSTNAAFTFTTGNQTVSESNQLPRERFGIVLQDAGGNPIADSFLTVDIRCIQSADQQSTGRVTETFRLTLKGDVPAGETFVVSYGSKYPSGEEPSEIVAFCSDDSSVSPRRCEAGTYTITREFPSGTSLQFSYLRQDKASPGGKEFYSHTATLSSDRTDDGWYSFDDSQLPRLPNTGAGGSRAGDIASALRVSLLVLAVGIRPWIRASR